MESLKQAYPTKIRTHKGAMDLVEFCPKSLGDLDNEATEKWLWAKKLSVDKFKARGVCEAPGLSCEGKRFVRMGVA